MDAKPPQPRFFCEKSVLCLSLGIGAVQFFDGIARHFLALRLVFARFDPRHLGQHLPPAAPRAACFAEIVPLARIPGAHHPRQARQPRSPGREGFRARSTLKSVHWTDLTPPSRGRVLSRQARPDLPAIGVRHLRCLPPCGVQQSGRVFPHRGTADPTLEPRHGDRGVGVKVGKPLPSNPEPL